MRIVLTRTLNERNGLVEGSIHDWLKPAITQMTEQLKEREGDQYQPWFRYDTEMVSRMERITRREQNRPDYLSDPALPADPEAPENVEVEQAPHRTTAEAILAEQDGVGARQAAQVEAPRAPRGPGRPPKQRELVSA